MRYVDRSTVTLSQSVATKADAELADFREHLADTSPDKKSFDFKVYKLEEIKQALEKLFHGKCAYCETFYSASAPVDVEHYRPKGAVAEAPTHPGYWWLAMRWENLLPSCIDCNRKRNQKIADNATTLQQLWQFGKDARKLDTKQVGKKDSFPIATGAEYLLNEEVDFGRERALLINPCTDKPQEYLAFNVVERSVPAVVHALDSHLPDSRGNASIHVFGLNRLGLVQDRTRILRQMDFLADMALEVTEVAEKMDMLPEAQKLGIEQAPARLRFLRDRILTELAQMASPKSPYSAMASEWLDGFMKKLA